MFAKAIEITSYLVFRKAEETLFYILPCVCQDNKKPLPCVSEGRGNNLLPCVCQGHRHNLLPCVWQDHKNNRLANNMTRHL